MGLCANVYRRGGVYWWRKKARVGATKTFRTLAVSLMVREPARAKMLGAILNARFILLGPKIMTGELSLEQLREIFADFVRCETRRWDDSTFRVVSGQESPIFGGDVMGALQLRDLLLSEAYLFAAKRGHALKLDDALKNELRDRGNDEDAVDKIVTMLRDWDDLILRPCEEDRLFLQDVLDSHGVEANAATLNLAWNMLQQARSQALCDTRRYYERDLIGMDAIYAQTVAEVDANPAFNRPDRAPNIIRDESPVGPLKPAIVPPPPSPPVTVASLDDHPIVVWGERYIEDALNIGLIADPKQHRRIYRLFAEMLIEQKLFGLTEIRQTHVAALKALFNELPTSYGKSSRDTTLKDLRRRGQGLKPSERGIGPGTLGRHMGNLNKLFEFIRDHGGAIDPQLAPNRLRPKKPKRERKRDKRKAFNPDDLRSIFELPCFTGCNGWDRGDLFVAGPKVFHRALYFAVILLAYSGARREEICGLEVADVFLDHEIPYIHLQDNETRRVKNDVSERLIPIHPEALRLGFAQYVEKIRTLGYKLVFPDLKSPTSSSPLGDRLYDEFIAGLKIAVPEEGRRKRVIHSFRHTIGAVLKKSKVDKETRADILGHAGESATDEIYVDATELKDMLDDLMKVPIATAHLQSRPIMLLPWVAQKQKPPFSHPLRSSKLRAPYSKAPSPDS